MIVVNLHVEPFDVYGGRAGNGYDGYFGNPYRLQREEDRPRILELYRQYFYRRINRDPEFRRRVLGLRGKRVGCFCRPKACHLDVIAEWVNSREEGAVLPDELQRFGVGSIWRKRVAPLVFELRRIEAIEGRKIVSVSHIDEGRVHYDYEFVDLYVPLGADPSTMSLAGSGHRPEHIARGNRTLEDVRDQIFTFYKDLLSWLRPREVISGLARGFDLWLGWAAIQAEVPLIGAKPYPEQTRNWSAEDQQEWEALADACTEIHTVSPHFWEREGDNALFARNRWMVDRCTHLISFWQGTRGGTAHANEYAVKVGRPRLMISSLDGWTTQRR